jgi:hydroxypyruvate isomerase
MMNRRDMLRTVGLAAAAVAVGGTRARAEDAKPPATKGRIKQAACGGVFGKMPLEEKAATCKRLGLHGIDLVGPDAFETLKKYGLLGTMVPSGKLAKGLNHKENHEECLASMRAAVEAASAAGFPNVICFSGNRAGIGEEEGMQNCAVALKQVVALAEAKKVTLCMELLNSKRNHKDYQCDHTAWGVALCKLVGSPNFKLLYDIYHMQIMEGDIMATIKENVAFIGHIHTAGNPGRHQMDESQELFYPAIMRAIAESGYQGFVSHEYSPTHDPIPVLEAMIKLCDV